MPTDFEIKKVPMETLGEYLLEIRQQLGFTLEQVAQKTGIYEKFLHSLESGKYQDLPPDVYVLGFLKKIADTYSVPQLVLLEQYKKERGIAEQVTRERITPKKGIRALFSNLAITPKLITVVGGISVGVIAFLYIVFQVFAINTTPALEVFEPQNDAVITGTSINVSGKTESNVDVSINGQKIVVGDDGLFQTDIGVAPGQKELHIESQNKFGKKNTKIVTVRVEETEQAVSGEDDLIQLELELSFAKETEISLNIDGVVIPSEIIPARGIKKISGKQSITLTTQDAGSTEAVLNGEPLGVLGKDDQELTIPFTAESTSKLLQTFRFVENQQQSNL